MRDRIIDSQSGVASMTRVSYLAFLTRLSYLLYCLNLLHHCHQKAKVMSAIAS